MRFLCACAVHSFLNRQEENTGRSTILQPFYEEYPYSFFSFFIIFASKYHFNMKI